MSGFALAGFGFGFVFEVVLGKVVSGSWELACRGFVALEKKPLVQRVAAIVARITTKIPAPTAVARPRPLRCPSGLVKGLESPGMMNPCS